MVLELVALHGHQSLVLEVIVVVQFLELGYTVLASRRTKVTTAVLSQQQEDLIAWTLIFADILGYLRRDALVMSRLVSWLQ